MKGEKREAMRNLPRDRKRYLLQQNRIMKASSGKESSSSPAQAATVGLARANQTLPALAPNLTGDNNAMRRFSITSWASHSTDQPSDHSSSTPQMATKADSPIKSRDNDEEIKPLQPQTTGALWSSWWTSSGGDWSMTFSKGRTGAKESTQSAAYYVEGIKSRRSTDVKLVKHLISLRVHISTAKLSWVEQFIDEHNGMNALATLLSGLVGKGGKRRKLTDTEESVLYEVIKCLRVLLNTEVSVSSLFTLNFL